MSRERSVHGAKSQLPRRKRRNKTPAFSLRQLMTKITNGNTDATVIEATET
jgi:hypothetical protein